MTICKNTDYISITANINSGEGYENNKLHTKSLFNEALSQSSTPTIGDHGISVTWSRLTKKAKTFLSGVPGLPLSFPKNQSTLFVGSYEDYFEETCFAIWASKIKKKPLSIDVIIDLNNDPFVLSLVTGILDKIQKERPLHILSLKCDNKTDFSNLIYPDETSLSLISKSLFDNEKQRSESLSYLLEETDDISPKTLDILNESKTNGFLSLIDSEKNKGYELSDLFSPGSTVLLQLPIAIYRDVDKASARLLDVLNMCKSIKSLEKNHSVDFNITISGLGSEEIIPEPYINWMANNTNVIMNALYSEKSSGWVDFAIDKFDSSYLAKTDLLVKIPRSVHCISDTIMELNESSIGSPVVLVQKGKFVNIPLKISPPSLPREVIPKEIKHNTH